MDSLHALDHLLRLMEKLVRLGAKVYHIGGALIAGLLEVIALEGPPSKSRTRIGERKRGNRAEDGAELMGAVLVHEWEIETRGVLGS